MIAALLHGCSGSTAASRDETAGLRTEQFTIHQLSRISISSERKRFIHQIHTLSRRWCTCTRLSPVGSSQELGERYNSQGK